MRAVEGRDERGFTLVELTVALMLMGIVSALLFGFMASVLKTTTTATSNAQAEQATELALRPMTQDIRGASTIATTYPTVTTSCATGSYPTGYRNCISFTISRPTPGQLTCPKSVVAYGLKPDGVIRVDRTDYEVVGASCVATQLYIGRPVLSGVVNSTTPLFRYFDRFGNELDPNASGQSTLAFTQAETVRVSVNVQHKKNAPLLSYTSDLALRNNR
jgi:prepilin-type N-terminal cleavage/methylation domain-containing protein